MNTIGGLDMDKRIATIGIALFLALFVMAAGEVSVSPSSTTLDLTQGQTLNSTLVLSNDNSGENKSFLFPESINLTGSISQINLSLSFNVTNPVNITNGTNQTINFTLTAPKSIYQDTFVGTINFTNNNSDSVLHTVTINLAALDIVDVTPTAQNLTANSSGSTTGVFLLRNSDATFNVTATLPSSTTLVGDRINQTATITYNVSSPVTVQAGASASINYTLVVPAATFNDTYSSILNFTVNTSDTAILTLSTRILGIDNATINSSATSAVIGKTANASILVSNTGNTDLDTLNFSVTDLVDTSNSSNVIKSGNVTLPANFALLFNGTNVPTFNISIPSTTENGTYSGNLTLNYPGLIPVNSTLSVVVSPSSFSISFSESPVDMGNVDTNSTKSKTFSITNTGNDVLNNLTLINSNIAGRFNFTILDNSTTSLGPGDSRSFTISIFAPNGETTGDQVLGNIQVTSAELNSSVSVAATIQGKLVISDVDVKVDDSTDSNVADGDTITKRAKPGDEVEFEVTVRNLFTDSEDINIEDVVITITIEDIDDGDELEEESRKFDVDANEDETETITFNVPEDAEEDEYDVLIEVEGEDEDGNDHEVEFNLVLRVDRDRHKLIFSRVELESAILTCNKNGRLRVTAQNIGSTNEDESVLEVRSNDLGISFRETFELEEDPGDSDNTFSKDFRFTVPDSVAAGDYPIELRLYYDTDKVIDVETPILKIAACNAGTTTPVVTPPTTTTTTTTDGEVTVIAPTTTTAPTTSGTTPSANVPSGFVSVDKVEDSNLYFAALIIANLIVVGLVIVLLVQLVKPKV
tara:strand:- start:9066 stop:11504 length:2439 start_codon:yes stop_codon:yes gene_type:complete